MTSRRRNLVIAAVALPLLLVLALVLLPLALRGPIEARLVAAVNERVTADVAWSDVGIGAFRNFPNLTFTLRDLTIAGHAPFAGDTLLSLPRLRLAVDVGSAWRAARGTGPLVIRSLEMRDPAVRLLVDEDGARNWDIVRADGAEATSPSDRAFALSLRALELSGGRVAYEDRQAHLHATVIGLAESLRGDFARERFTLETGTLADSVWLRFAGVPYLAGARLQVRADVDADMAARRFTIRDNNEIRLNELVLAVTGSVAPTPDSVALDLSFRAPATEFRHILSLVPAVYAQDFANVQTSGTMRVAGTVRGGWGPATFPALALEAKVDDGMFRYPDLPLPARDIALDLAVSNPGGSADSTVVELRRLHVLLGGDPVDGTFALRTPVSDPDVALRLHGRIDLANVARTVKLQGVDSLRGVVVADAAMRARKSDLDARRYENTSATGGFSVTGLSVRSAELPHPLDIDTLQLQLSPREAALTALRARVGRSDVAATGTLHNLLGFVLHDEELRGEARVRSEYFDLNEWRSDDELRAIVVPGGVDFGVQAQAARVTFGELELRNAHGEIRIRDRRATLSDFGMELLGGTLVMSGWYDTTTPERPTFDIDAQVDGFSVQGAFTGIRTVQAFAPVARYAEGSVSGTLKLAGAMDTAMMPVREVLTGLGSIETTQLVLRDFPALDRLADGLKIDQLRDPGFKDLKSSLEIRDGRLFVKPFDVQVAGFTMSVAGSNGLDQSLAYDLGLQLPRSLLGGEANRVVGALVAQSGRAGVALQPSDVVTLGITMGGTVTSPEVSWNVRQLTQGAAQDVARALREAADARADSARARAALEAAAIIAEAEARAERIREEASAAAARLKAEGYEGADTLVARAKNPVARAAAQVAAERLRKETDQRADALVRAAAAQADSLVAEARRRAGEDG